jgi:hypothetical protein
VEADTEIEELEAGYGRFASNAGGVTNVAAGGLILAAYFLATMIDVLGAWTRALLGLTPFAWVAVKELLRKQYARRHGASNEWIEGSHRRWHRLFTSITALIGAMVVAVAVASLSDASFPVGRALPFWAYVLFGVATPIVVWRFVRTREEILVGLFLVAQAAFFLVSANLELGTGIQMPVVAGVALLLGVKQRLEYRQLDGEVRCRRASAGRGGT